jgi:uncharacterized protein (DUF2252 family)
MKTVAERIRSFNAGRDPERLAMKLARLRASPFGFFRGTCHLFYKGLSRDGIFATAPAGWICGDAHLENFGSYKGDNRLAYFDLDDFDEAAIAPVTWDVVRLLCSILVAGDSLRATEAECLSLCDDLLQGYVATLQSGRAGWIERETSTGLIRDLLDDVRTRKRSDFLDRRTLRKGKARTILCDGQRALPVDAAQRAQATALVDGFGKTQDDATFYEVLDVARRIAGTGSLGVERFIVLIRGKGSPDGNYLLDIKQALPSSPGRRVDLEQPRWPSQAQRVVALQQRLQAVPMAFLHAVVGARTSYVLRGLQPSEDRIGLNAPGTTLPRLRDAIRDMGRLLASAHLRGSGRQGSATADELIEFAASSARWRRSMQDEAGRCAAQVRTQWRDYSAAYDAGAFAR